MEYSSPLKDLEAFNNSNNSDYKFSLVYFLELVMTWF